MTVLLRPLHTLEQFPPDERRFKLPLSGKTGTLLYCSLTSCMVSYGAKKQEIRTVVVEHGQEVEKITTFEKADRVSVARETMVVRLLQKGKETK